MSSFVVSRNTSQPLILRDQDVGDNWAPERSYSFNETLNFLVLLVSYVHDYTWSLVTHFDGVMMHLEELLVQNRQGTSPRLVKIHFHPDKIINATGLMTAFISTAMHLLSGIYII